MQLQSGAILAIACLVMDMQLRFLENTSELQSGETLAVACLVTHMRPPHFPDKNTTELQSVAILKIACLVVDMQQSLPTKHHRIVVSL